MGSIAEKIFEAVKNLPDQQAAPILDFAQALQARRNHGQGQCQAVTLARATTISLGRLKARTYTNTHAPVRVRQRCKPFAHKPVK